MSNPARTQQEWEGLRREAEAELKGRYAGVEGVGLALRVQGGKTSDEIVLRVYVWEKKPASQLKPDEMIPAQYQDVPTDVHKIPRIVGSVDATPCANRAQYSTLAGGITISTMKPAASGALGLGTLGFFVTFTGEDPPYNIGLVTNNHVVSRSGGVVGDSMYQPQWVPQPLGQPPNLIVEKASLVGKVLRLPPKADVGGKYVDAALVKLNICISSWCHTNCGVSFANTQPGLNVAGGDAILDVGAPPQIGDIVFKVGRTTGRTQGKITSVTAMLIDIDGTTGHNAIEIEGLSMQTPGNCGGALRFDDEGDSGAALIDAHGKLIGLVFGHDPDNPNHTQASDLQAVLTALGGVVPITKANPVHGNPAAEGMRAEAPAVIEGRPNQTAILRARFLDCERGRQIAEIVERHRLEVVFLVNNKRRVTVAWRRNQGPAFLNRAMTNARDSEQLIPREIEGVSRETLLLKMADALREYGSPELREAVDRYASLALSYAAEFDSLHDVVDEWLAQPAEKVPV